MVYLLALISIMLGAVGQFLLKLVALGLKNKGSVLELVFSLINYKIVLAVTCFVTSMLMWIFVVRKLELSIAYPMVSMGYVFVMILSACFLQEHVYWTKLLGTAMIVAGVIVLNLK